jgi:nucleotide-binding universal stress UspA family protein
MSLHGPILVPLDGSDLAERAVPVAAALAHRAAAELLLVHVHVPISAHPIHVEGLPVIDEQMHSLRRDHEQAYLVGACPRPPGVGASTALLEGPVAVALSEQARRSGARLIVMTTHGRGGFDRAWLGSVADELAHASVPCPAPGPTQPGRAPSVATHPGSLDGSPLRGVLEPAVSLARLGPTRFCPCRTVRVWRHGC